MAIKNSIHCLGWMIGGLLLASCEQVIELEIPESEPRLVVEGWIYDDRDVQTIMLRNSVPILEEDTLPPETQAQVVVTTERGETFPYTETEAGIYQSRFRGTIGNRYTLTIETRRAQSYVSTPQWLLPVASLDSVYTVFKEPPTAKTPGYYPYWQYTDLPDSEDYYRWKFYVNGVFQNAPEAILILSDQFVDGEEIIGEFLAVGPLVVKDTLTVEQLSISEEAQIFFFRLTQVAGVSGFFDAPPEPLEGNITNITNEQDYALGFFGASSVVRATTIVQ